MQSAIVVSWSIFSIACSVPGFAYLPPPIGSRTSLTPICRRRIEWDGSFRTCHSSPWQHRQHQKQKNRHHRFFFDRSQGGVLSSLARDVNGDVHAPPPPRKATSSGRQSEYVSVQHMGCHIINSSFFVTLLFLLHLTFILSTWIPLYSQYRFGTYTSLNRAIKTRRRVLLLPPPSFKHSFPSLLHRKMCKYILHYLTSRANRKEKGQP